MAAKYLLDTHVLVRWLAEPKSLSRDQARILRDAVRRAQPAAVSEVTLLEIAVLLGTGRHRLRAGVDELLGYLDSSPMIRMLPLTTAIASEVFRLGTLLPDPADRAIVATARVHRLQLLTSDPRIIQSGLVHVVE